MGGGPLVRGLKVNFIYQDLGGGKSADAAMTRLRTDQMLRAVRVATGLGAAVQGVPARAAGVSGQLLDDDEPGGDDARIIKNGSSAWEDLGASGKKSKRDRMR